MFINAARGNPTESPLRHVTLLSEVEKCVSRNQADDFRQKQQHLKLDPLDSSSEKFRNSTRLKKKPNTVPDNCRKVGL